MSDTTPDDTTRLANLEREVERSRVRRDSRTLIIFAVAAGDGSGGGTVEADLFAIDLSSDEIATGGAITVRNNGSTVHDLAVRDTDLIAADIEAGESTSLDLGGLDAGTYQLYCTVPGHAEAGMTTQLTVGGDGAGETAAGPTTASPPRRAPPATGP
jgi:plastocyanin